MKLITALPIVLGIGILAGCAQQSDAPPSAEPAQAMIAAPDSQSIDAASTDGLVLSFEFLGCSGGWPSEDGTPDVWRLGSQDRVQFLVRHADTCDYTIGKKPAASIKENSLELSYELSNTSGELAACPCEYWAKFELASAPETIEKISFNGVDARLNGNLVRR